MDTSLARLKPIPAKFRSLAARAGDIPGFFQRYEQAGRLLVEFIDAGGLDDPKNVVAAYQMRGNLEGLDLRPGSDDWSQVWETALQRLLTPEQLADYRADCKNPALPDEPYIAHFANHCRLIADFMDQEIQRIRERATAGPGSRRVRKRSPQPTFDLETRTLNTGKRAVKLESSATYVLKALIENSPADLDTLRRAADKPDRILRTLRETYPELKKHIILPGGRGKGGYRTTIRLVDSATI